MFNNQRRLPRSNPPYKFEKPSLSIVPWLARSGLTVIGQRSHNYSVRLNRLDEAPRFMHDSEASPRDGSS